MKNVFLAFAFVISFSGPIEALSAERVKSYVRKDGTYVDSHFRSNSDKSFYNNWSSRGNSNPFTGSRGSKTRQKYFLPN